MSPPEKREGNGEGENVGMQVKLQQPLAPDQKPPDGLNGPAMHSILSSVVPEERSERDEGGAGATSAPPGSRGRSKDLSRITVSREPLFAFPESLPPEVQACLGTVERSQRMEANAMVRLIKTTRREADGLRDRVVSLEAQIDDLHELKDDRLTRLQTQILRHSDSDKLDIEYDDDIVAQFENHMRRIKSWVKKYGVSGTAMALDEASKFEIVSGLTDGPLAATSAVDMARLFGLGVAATTVLNALVTKIVAEKLLARPFFFLETINGSRSKRDLRDLVEDIFDLGYEVNPDKARVWRSQTVTLFHPKGAVTPSDQAAGLMVQTAKTGRYSDCVRSIFAHPAVIHLLRDVFPEDQAARSNALSNLVVEIGDFILRLATQKVDMRVIPFTQVAAERFVNGSARFRPHPTQFIDEGDCSHDGKRILLVVEPLILAFGNEDGHDYQSSKLWHAAVVVVDTHSPDTELTRPLPPPVVSAKEDSTSHGTTAPQSGEDAVRSLRKEKRKRKRERAIAPDSDPSKKSKPQRESSSKKHAKDKGPDTPAPSVPDQMPDSQHQEDEIAQVDLPIVVTDLSPERRHSEATE